MRTPEDYREIYIPRNPIKYLTESCCCCKVLPLTWLEAVIQKTAKQSILGKQLLKLTKYKHHREDERDEACGGLLTALKGDANVVGGAVVQRCVVRRRGAWRAGRGVGGDG